MYGACSTKPDAAAELRAGQAQGIAEVPQQRCIRITVEGVCYSVYLELNRICHIVAIGESQSQGLTRMSSVRLRNIEVILDFNVMTISTTRTVKLKAILSR